MQKHHFTSNRHADKQILPQWMLHCTMAFYDTARGPPFEIVASILALAVDSPQAAIPL
jgi:hypothetical protein